MKKTAVFLLILSMLGFTAFSLTVPQQQKSDVSRFKSFSLSVPDTWEKSEKENTRGKGETYYLYSSPADENGKKTSMTIIVSKHKSSSPDEYAKKLLMNYGKQFGDFELTEKKELKINGVPFASFKIQHNTKGEDYINWTVFTMEKDILYQINTIATEKKLKEDLNTVNKILASFKIIDFK